MFFLWKLRDYIQRRECTTFSAQGEMVIRLGQRSPTGQWRQRLIDADWALTCAWINAWVNSRGAGNLRRHCAHYDVILMVTEFANKAIYLAAPKATGYCRLNSLPPSRSVFSTTDLYFETHWRRFLSHCHCRVLYIADVANYQTWAWCALNDNGNSTSLEDLLGKGF